MMSKADKTKSLRPFDAKPSAKDAPGGKGGGYLGKKIKDGKGTGSLGLFGKKGKGKMSGVQV